MLVCDGYPTWRVIENRFTELVRANHAYRQHSVMAAGTFSLNMNYSFPLSALHASITGNAEDEAGKQK
jgi:hypothetical protein